MYVVLSIWKNYSRLSPFFVFWWIDSYTLHPSTLRMGIFLNFVKLFKAKIWWESWKANWRPPWPSRPESCNWLGSPNSCWEAGGMWICDVFTVFFCDFCQWFCFFLLNAGFVLLAVLASEIFADRVAAKFHMKTYLWGQVTDMSSDTVPISENLDTVLNCWRVWEVSLTPSVVDVIRY